MYAIVRTGGKQYRVERGQHLLIERVPAEQGAEISLEPLLYRSDEAVLDKQGLERVKVTAKVIEHVRGEKLRVFKFKPKRGYRRRTGHRQELTRVEITDIAQEGRKPATAKPAGAEAKAKPAGSEAKARPADAEAKAKPAGSEAKARPAGAEAKPGAAQAKPKAKPQRAAKAAPAGAEGDTTEGKAKPARAAKPAAGAEGASKAKPKPARPAKPRKDADGS
jgi:large subunit ribosomal protein L21